MSFDYIIAYEDRDEVRTSRWKLDGVKTLAAGNTGSGWLWATITNAGDTVTVDLYKSRGTTSADKVATGTCSKATLPVVCTLTAANTSGMSGEVWLHEYTSQPVAQIPVMVSLAVDADLSIEYSGLSDLPAYSATAGMADYVAEATRRCLLLASQVFSEQLGGFRAPEHRNVAASAAREFPDYRRLANPDQLRTAAIHWALELAFGRSHERGSDTMYSELRDYHAEQRKDAVSAWNLTFTSEPDAEADADQAQGAVTVRPSRL